MRAPAVTLALVAALSLASPAPADPLRLDSGDLVPDATNGTALVALLDRDPDAAGRHVIVQLQRIPDAAERRDLAARGLTLLHYIPVRGYLAHVAREAVQDPAVLAWIGWSADIPRADKRHGMIRTGQHPPYATAADGRLRLVVYSFAGVRPSDFAATLTAAGAEVLGEEPVFHRTSVLLPTDRLDAVTDLDAVRWIRHVSPPAEDDLDFLRPDQQADLVQAPPYNLTGAGVAIGQTESGNPDDTHDDIQGRIHKIQTLSTSTHATHVAGIAAGTGVLSVSGGGTPQQWRGVATAAEMWSWGSGSTHLSHYAAAIDSGIVMSTNSWGWSVSSANCSLYGDYSNDAPEMDQIITGLHGRRIITIHSAGNERNDCDCGMSCAPDYINYANQRPPGATAKNTLSIGAKYSNIGALTTFSSWGPMDDGRLKPEVVAAGDHSTAAGIYAPYPGDTYGYLAGTSMSTPAAAGVVALFVEDYRNLIGADPLPCTMKAHLVHTALDMDDATPYLNPGPDYATGYGVIQAKDLIDQLRSGNFVEDTVDQGQSDVRPLVVPGDATTVEITLAWDDEAGAQNANPALVNDLDLVVTDAAGTRHYPWTLNPAVPAADAVQTQEDHLNPLEKVDVSGALAAGTWTIEVRGTTVPMGPQVYSLVWSHDGSPGAVAADEVAPAPDGLRVVTLHPSHPNPSRPWTTIRYALAEGSNVDLRILDVRGRVVRTLVRAERQTPGTYTYTWRGRRDDGDALPSGVYLVELRAGDERRSRKVTLLR